MARSIRYENVVNYNFLVILVKAMENEYLSNERFKKCEKIIQLLEKGLITNREALELIVTESIENRSEIVKE